MEQVVFKDMGAYFLKSQNTFAQYIAMHPILEICEDTVQRPGAWVARRWWEKEGMYLADARAAAAAVAESYIKSVRGKCRRGRQ